MNIHRRQLVGIIGCMVLLGAGACSGKVPQETPASASDSMATTTVAPGVVATTATTAPTGATTAPSGQGSSKAGRGTEAQGSSPPTSTSIPPFEQEKQGPPLPIELSIAPSCGRVGDTLTVTMKSAPSALVSILAMYNDGNSHETWHVGTAPESAIVKWSFRIVPQAETGEAQILSSARENVQGGRSGTATAPFRVAGLEGCG